MVLLLCASIQAAGDGLDGGREVFVRAWIGMVIIRTGQGNAWKNRRKTTSPGGLIGSGTAGIPKHSRCLTGQFPLIRGAPGHGTAVRPHLATWVFFLLLSIPAIRR